MTKRFRWILVGLVIGFVTGGVAYAVVVNPPNSSDRYYACVSPAGVVRSGTVRLNAAPTKCPSATDQVRSWNAVGPTGPNGVAGDVGPTGATGARSGYLDYVGVYSLTFTHDGCTGWAVRVRVVPQHGAPPAETPLGPCSPLRDASSEAVVQSLDSTNVDRTLSVRVDIGFQDRFGSSGTSRILSFAGAPFGGSTFCAGPGTPPTPPTFLGNRFGCPPRYFWGEDVGAYVDGLWSHDGDDYGPFLVMDIPAGSTIPDPASIQWTDDADLFQFEVLTVP